MIRVQIVNTIINTTTTNVNFWLGYSCILSAKSVYPATRTSSLSALYSGIVIFLTLLYSSQFRLQFPLGLEFEGCETVFGLSAGGAGIHSEPFQYQLPSSLNVMISPMNDSFQTFLWFEVRFYTRTHVIILVEPTGQDFDCHSFSEIHSLLSQWVVMSTLISSPQIAHFERNLISPASQLSGHNLGIPSTGSCIYVGQVIVV